MEYFSIVFMLIFLTFVLYFIYMFFTKRGQLLSVKMITGSDVVNDLGELGDSEFETKIGYRVNQKLKLYECVKANESYYILESTQKNIGAINRHYTKLTQESLMKLRQYTE